MVRFLSDVVAALVDRSAERLRERLVATSIMYLAAGLCAVTALGFTTAAIYVVLARAAGPVGAAAIVAAVYAAVAVVLVLLARQREIARDLADRPNTRLSDADAVAQLTAAFITGLRAGRGDD